MQVRPDQKVQERLSGEQGHPEILEAAPGHVLAITPLGGVGEVGKNLTVIECQGKALVVDCGLRFPNPDEHPGIDLIIPDFSYLRALGKGLLGLVLTHGHEDHIGALAFLLKEMPLTLYGTKFTLEMAKGRIQEMGVLDQAKFIEVEAGERTKLGPFELRYFAVCHSVADGIGVAIKTPLGLVVHSGDFKFDADPVDGRRIDRGFLKSLGEEGVLALMSDSTNVERPDWCPSERSVLPALTQAIADAKRRVIVTAFSSHVHRFQQVLEAAAATGRKVAPLGRSMESNMRLARELGYLKPPKDTLVDFSSLKGMPPQKTIVVSTGSQGEPRSGLARMAEGAHSDIKVEGGDLLVYSARSIPGNERTVGALINNFYKRGAEVLTERQARIHVSGHGGREDLRELLRLLKPKYLLPGHGELRHQVVHRKLAFEEGLDADHVYLLENGQRWTWDGRDARADVYVPAGEVLVDGLIQGEESNLVLRDRQHLKEDGLVVCSVGLSRKHGDVLQGPWLLAKGLMAQDTEGLLEQAEHAVHQALSELAAHGQPPDYDQARDVITTTLKRFFKKRLQARPVIVPSVLEI
jgi:ribonuclease J